MKNLNPLFEIAIDRRVIRAIPRTHFVKGTMSNIDVKRAAQKVKNGARDGTLIGGAGRRFVRGSRRIGSPYTQKF